MTFKSFQDLFTRDEIRLWGDVRGTGNPIIFPILVSAPTQYDRNWSDRVYDEFMTLRLYYAMQVWAAAYANISERERPHLPLNSYVWENWNESFRIVRFTNPNHKEMLRAFWQELERIADSGEIKVSEGRFRRMDRKAACQIEKGHYSRMFERSTGIQVVADTDEIPRSHRRGRDYVLPFKGTADKTYSWGEIKTLFVELPEKLLSCFGEERMHRYEEADAPLFKACEKLNLEEVKKAVANGANVNALDEMGESAITVCCKATGWYYDEIKASTPGESEKSPLSDPAIEEQRTTTAMGIISFLLGKGAKIDLCGGSGCTPLYQTHLLPSIKLMRFFLEHGANPNVNCYLTDEPTEFYIVSSTLSGIWDDQGCDGDTPQREEMERLLLEYGARFYIDGFDPRVEWKEYSTEKIPKIHDSLIQPTAKLSELDRRLYVACAEVQVCSILSALSIGANINLRDAEGRNLLAVAIEFGSQIGAAIHKARYEANRSFYILCKDHRCCIEEKLLTVVICLFGQKIQLTSEDLSDAIHLARQHGYTKVAAWLDEKQTRS